jgi:hypothetical protein
MELQISSSFLTNGTAAFLQESGGYQMRLLALKWGGDEHVLVFPSAS